MRAITFLGDRQIEFVEAPEPRSGAGEVLIEIRAAGICGSDLGFLYRPSVQETTAEPSAYDQWIPNQVGVIPGHEPAGVIVEVGPAVHHLAVGDRVACYHISGCNECRACRAGWMLHCRSYRSYGWQRDGAFAERMVADSSTAPIAHAGRGQPIRRPSAVIPPAARRPPSSVWGASGLPG